MTVWQSGMVMTPARLNGEWVNYTPTWAGASGNPSLGNGSIAGRYLRMGQLVTYVGSINMGSTTTYGSGIWTVTVPIAAAGGSAGLTVGEAWIYDASTGANQRAAAVKFATAATIDFWSDGGAVTSAVPFAWASPDQLRWTIQYEPA